MKRILTLFVMALMSWGFLSAQNGPEVKVGPKINFQAVIRHHDAVNNMDTLFHDQTVTCTIWVAKMDVGAYYAEVHRNVPTTENGLLSLKIGEGEPLPDYADRSLLDVDWSDWAIIFADIDLGIDGEEPVSFNVMITGMPYAIQAGIGPLTTEMIVEYSKNVIDDEGMTQILDAIRANPNGLKDGLKQWVIQYIKDNREIAKYVVQEYLDHFDAQNVHEAYDALNTNPRKAQLRALLKNLLVANRPMAKELALWFINSATAYDIQRTYETFLNVPTATKEAAWDLLVDYVTDPANRTMIYNLGIYFVENVITSEDAANAYNTLKTVNPAVKNDLRSKVDEYVWRYVDNHPGCLDVDQSVVNQAIDNYLQEHPRIPNPTDCQVDICDMKEAFDHIEY
ncbi:MAG: hypothetical protein IKO81_01805 [Bacteroidales bacterium]|nr:hypothetical protein [Bacteroidales bacterium]